MPATILIVEDHPAMRAVLTAWLSEAFAGCRIIEAASGEAAVAAVEQSPPDVALVDIGLPTMNGLEATRRIKAIAPAVRVIIVTNYGASAYRAEARELGACAFILKQHLNTELLPALQGILPPP